jgi:hypothetical protein
MIATLANQQVTSLGGQSRPRPRAGQAGRQVGLVLFAGSVLLLLVLRLKPVGSKHELVPPEPAPAAVLRLG